MLKGNLCKFPEVVIYKSTQKIVPRACAMPERRLGRKVSGGGDGKNVGILWGMWKNMINFAK